MLFISHLYLTFIIILFNSLFTSGLYIPNLNIRSFTDDNKDNYKVDSSLIPGFQEEWNDLLLMNAGHIPVTDDNSTLYFWSFQSKNESLGTKIYNDNNDNERPLIIWLNGGPGCSSMDGALMEVGPLRILNKDSIVWNEGWFNVADLLFIDQPIGTGFSYRMANDNYDSNLADSTNHLFTFIDNYFNLFNENFDKYNSIIIAGESYAGQYIPHLARLLKNSNKFSNKLTAILLGNAWLDPNLQSLSYIPFAIDNGIINPTDESQDRKLTSLLESEQKCQNIRTSQPGKEKFEVEDCEKILTKFLRSYRDKDKNCINVYDIKKTDSYPSCGNNWPELLNDQTQFLNNEKIQNALNVLKPGHNSNTWKECSNEVGKYYNPSDDIIGASLLNDLLNDGVKVNLFSGTNDLICNYLSTEMVIKNHLTNYLSDHNYKIYLDSLNNHNKLLKREIEKFQMDSNWIHDNSKVGSFWQRGNLTYIKVDNASHMVAYDVSKISIGLINLSLRDYNENSENSENTVNSEVKTYSDFKTKYEIEEQERQKIEKEQKQKQHEEEEKEHEIEKKKAPKKYLALFLLIIVLAILAIYFFKVSTKKPSRYSALAGAHKPSTYSRYAYEWVSGSSNKNNKGKNGNKKKRVHWVDLEESNEESTSNSPNDLQLESYDNNVNIEGNDNNNTNNHNKFKSFEMEDLQLNNSDNLFNDKPHEGTFEAEQLELELDDLTKSKFIGENK